MRDFESEHESMRYSLHAAKDTTPIRHMVHRAAFVAISAFKNAEEKTAHIVPVDGSVETAPEPGQGALAAVSASVSKHSSRRQELGSAPATDDSSGGKSLSHFGSAGSRRPASGEVATSGSVAAGTSKANLRFTAAQSIVGKRIMWSGKVVDDVVDMERSKQAGIAMRRACFDAGWPQLEGDLRGLCSKVSSDSRNAMRLAASGKSPSGRTGLLFAECGRCSCLYSLDALSDACRSYGQPQPRHPMCHQ